MDELLHSCPSCGTVAVPGAAYCHRCGSPLIDEEEGFEGPEEEFAGGATPPPSGGDQAMSGGGVPQAGGTDERADASSTPSRASRTPEAHTADASSVRFAGMPGAATGSGGSYGQPGQGYGPASARTGPAGMPAGTAASNRGGPGVDGSTTDPALERALRGEYEVRIGDWMAHGWAIFTQAGGLFVGFAAIAWLLTFFATPILLILFPLLASGFLTAGLIARRGERVQFSDFWLPFNDFLPLFLAWVVSCALMFAGLLTCGVLTIYLWVGYQFAYLLILDRRMEFWDALETSRKVVTKHWLSLFAFAIILLVINLIALAVATVGLIISLPLTSCFLVEAYVGIFGVRGGLRRQPDLLVAPASPATAAV